MADSTKFVPFDQWTRFAATRLSFGVWLEMGKFQSGLECWNSKALMDAAGLLPEQHITVKILCGTPLWAEDFNSSPLSATYMRQWIGSTLVQKIVWRQFGANPLSTPMLGHSCCLLGLFWQYARVKPVTQCGVNRYILLYCIHPKQNRTSFVNLRTKYIDGNTNDELLSTMIDQFKWQILVAWLSYRPCIMYIYHPSPWCWKNMTGGAMCRNKYILWYPKMVGLIELENCLWLTMWWDSSALVKIRTNAGILLIRPLGTNFSENRLKIQNWLIVVVKK